MIDSLEEVLGPNINKILDNSNKISNNIKPLKIINNRSLNLQGKYMMFD